MKFNELSISDQIALLDLATKTSDRIFKDVPDKIEYIDQIIEVAKMYAEKLVKS